MKAETKLAKILATEDSNTKLTKLWLLGCLVPTGCHTAKTVGAEIHRLVNAGYSFTSGVAMTLTRGRQNDRVQ